jgi:hypothetical protein
VAPPRGPGETAVDVRAGATVVLGGEAFAGAALAVDDDDLVVALPDNRTLILGGFFARGRTPARLAVGDAPPVPAEEVAAGLAAGGGLGQVPRRPVPARSTQPARAPRPVATTPARRVAPAAAGPPEVGLPGGPIRRVVKFVDAATAELPGFGAYAYVLMPDAGGPAGEELLAAMFAWERRARSDAPAARRVTFYVPVRDAAAARRGYDQTMPTTAPDRREARAWRRAARRLLAAADGYDRVRAREVLAGLCGPEGDGPPPCRGAAVTSGPHLLVTGLPLPRGGPPPEPYLLVDLAGHGGTGLARWVAVLAELTLGEGAPAPARLESVRAAAEAAAAELGGRDGGGEETVFLAPPF